MKNHYSLIFFFLAFAAILPASKNWEELNAILNEGYWKAFDDKLLDKDGLPPEDYFVDEEKRFERVGKYLEIFSTSEYPFANWYYHQAKLALDDLSFVDRGTMKYLLGIGAA